MSEKIRITEDDLRAVNVASPEVISKGADGTSTARDWGSISGDPTLIGSDEAQAARGSFLLKSWVYLMFAGAIGTFLGWVIVEPVFSDDDVDKVGNVLMMPVVTTVMCIAFAAAESIVERSMVKAASRGLLAVPIGVILSFIFLIGAGYIFEFGNTLILNSGGALNAENPTLWLVRSVAWCAFGASAGLIYGIVGQSWKKCFFGVLGGMLGATLGGVLFDPITLLTNGGGVSRCVGFMIFGAVTGIAIGLVESALKNRWLYVAGGPLAGKQFILYKRITQLGSQQADDIYLFKDSSILPVHATIELRGAVAILVATGPTFVGGRPVTQRVLRSGDLVQIGRYSFQYQEKQN